MSKDLEIVDGIVMIPHLGITLRTIMAAASNQNLVDETRHRKWRLSYKSCIIGCVRITNDRSVK